MSTLPDGDEDIELTDAEGNVCSLGTAEALELFVLGCQAAGVSVLDRSTGRWLSRSPEQKEADRVATMGGWAVAELWTCGHEAGAMCGECYR